MTFILSRNHSYFIIANIVLLGLIVMFALQKFGPLNDKETLKFFGSRLLYLYLVGCCSTFLVFFYNSFSKNFKKGAWIAVGMFYFALIGTLFNPYPRIRINYTHAELKIIDFKTSDMIDAHLNFLSFDPLFKQYLENAKDGKIKVFLRPFIVCPDTIDCQITIGRYSDIENQGFLLPETIKELLSNKTIHIKAKAKNNFTALLTERDFNKPSTTRCDTLFLNNQEIKFKYDNIVIVTFYFETTDGKPLAVFL